MNTAHFSISAGTLPIARALAALGERDGLDAASENFFPAGRGGRGADRLRLRRKVCSHGSTATSRRSAGTLARVEDELRALGRHYDAACVALDLAESLAMAGDESAAEVVRARANELLEPLGCVYPF